MLISPWQLLLGALGLLLLIRYTTRWAERRQSERIRRWAVGHRLRFSRIDRFDLARRAIVSLPGWNEAEITDVQVHDLVYWSDADAYRYLFTLTFRRSTPGGPKPDCRIGGAVESLSAEKAMLAEVHFLPARCRVDQYQQLFGRVSRRAEEHSEAAADPPVEG